MLLVSLWGSFAKDVKVVEGEVKTFKVQIPHGVAYSVECDSCSYEERVAEGIRYLDFRVFKSGKVYVGFPEVKGRGRTDLSIRAHALLSSMENPHPEWVVKPVYVLKSLSNPFSRAEVWVKVKITRAGVYEITYDMLKELGIDPSLYPEHTYKMIAMLDTFPSHVDSAHVWGRDVAIWVDREGERILFWGEPQASYRIRGGEPEFFRNPYTDTSVYFLGLGGEAGRRITVLKGSGGGPATPFRTYRHEVDKKNPGKKGRVWVGEEFVRLSTDPERFFPFEVEINDLDTRAGGALFRSGIAVDEFSDSVYVWVGTNGYSCDSALIMPANYAVLECDPVMINGRNEITFSLRVLASGQTAYLDYFEIIYPSTGNYGNDGIFLVKAGGDYTLRLKGGRPVFVWEVSDHYSPRIVESHSYSSGNLTVKAKVEGGSWGRIYVSNFARRPISLEIYQPKGLRSLDAEYVAIGRRKFKDAFSEFLNYRRDHLPVFNGERWYFVSGTVLWVDLEDVFDEFGLGNPDPVAIRNFLYNMNYRTGGLRPVYVVLVGDGTYDYRGITSLYFPDAFPPYYPKSLSLSVNNDFMGASDDFYGDFDGDYYSNVAIGRIPVRTPEELRNYLQKVMDYESLKNDGVWRFRVLLVADDAYGTSYCEYIHTYQVLYDIKPSIPSWMFVKPFLMEKYPFRGLSKPEATEDLFRAFSEGYLMISFFIHGNPIQMAHEKLLSVYDINRMDTRGQEAFITVLSCKVGAFDRLEPARVLGEEMMLERNRGIAVLSATALSYASLNASYAQKIYRYVDSIGRAPIGFLALQGKNLRYYALLGEPATMLALPDSVGGVSLPSDTITRGERNLAVCSNPAMFVATDLPERDTVSFSCTALRMPYYTMRPLAHNGPVGSDSVFFWMPSRGRLSDSTLLDTLEENSLLLCWNGWDVEVGFYPVLKRNSTLGSSKPRVVGFYAGDTLTDGFTLPTKARLSFKFFSEEGFDIRLGTKYASPPTVLLDNSRSDVLYVEILSDTTARAEYTVDYSSDPGKHTVAVSITSARGIKGYSIWELNFTEDDLRIRDLLPYPNPYRGGSFYLTFKLTQEADVKVRLYTPTGKLVRTYTYKGYAGFNSLSLPIPDLANGVYVMVVEAENETGNHKTFTRVLILR